MTTESARAAERIVGELIGKNVEFVQRRSPTWLQLRITEALLTAHAAGRHAMREEAAKLAEDWGYSNKPDHALGIAAAVRALKVEEG